MRILIIEDEKKIADAICKGLQREGYAVDLANDGVEGEELAIINSYDLIILDIILPKQDGWQTCTNLRNKKIIVPILMLTALGDVTDRIKGLDQGADDYLSKPFHFGELLARIRSLIRRNTVVKTTKIERFGVVLDQCLHQAARDGKEISLSAKEFSLLELFMMNPDKILTREKISEHLWDMNFDPKSNVIESFIKFLRQKIDKEFDKPLIHTVRGVGYLFSDKER
ncbi:MAG: response regulator transcription factor [Ignavibacteriales bacterium]|nr:response regulator transcription factor [Ignavibacteriales bacterium]